MNYTWLVEKYLEGELSGEALRNFELEILRKPEVAREVERVRAMNRFMKEQHLKLHGGSGLVEDFDDMENLLGEEEIRMELEELKVRKISSAHEGLEEFRNKLNETRISQDLKYTRSSKILVRKYSVWMAAVSIALLTATSVFFLLNGNETDYYSLFIENYTTPPGRVERSLSHTENGYYDAMAAYNKGNYARAWELMNAFPESGIDNDLLFFKAATAMELGLYREAIRIWTGLESDKLMENEAIWFKSLCYLALDDPESSRQTLEQIVRQELYYKNRASILLNKL